MESKSVLVELPKLTKAEFFEWKNSITELWLKQSKEKLAEAELKLLTSSYEIAGLKIKVFSLTKMKDVKEDTVDSQGKYDTIKQLLEARLGISLNGKMIDEITYEIKDAP